MMVMTAELSVARSHASAAAPTMAEPRWSLIDAAAIRRHVCAIRLLCDELNQPQEEVLHAYQCELRRLLEHATIVDYLPVLVSKHVRQLYRRRVQARDEGAPCAQAPALP